MARNYDSQCRRMDLHLRAKFPYLNTIIYKMEKSSYKIFIENYKDFNQISDYFHNNIRYMATNVTLNNITSDNFSSILPKICDTDISKDFEGVSFTIPSLKNYIYSKYPEINFVSIVEDFKNEILKLTINESMKLERIENIEKELYKIGIPFKIEIFIEINEQKTTFQSTNILNSDPLLMESSKKFKMLNLPFIERDEKLWFDSLDNIYNNKIRKSDLYFFDKNKTKCILNLSILNNVNIRNLLLLYDVIYCILPLKENMKSMLSLQKLVTDDLLYLVQVGRIIFINFQPESILDYGFLNEIYQENNNAVVGRRALSTLNLIDIVEIKNNYIFSDIEIKNKLISISSDLADSLNINYDNLMNFLFWPEQALRIGFESLNFTGPIGIGQFGVNNLINPLLPKENMEAYKFEFMMHSPSIHLAHSLDATYFPFFDEKHKYSDYPYISIMSNILNSFKQLNLNSSNVIKTNKSMELLSIFEINDFIPLEEFEQSSSNAFIRKGMNSLFYDLCNMQNNEKIEIIKKYNSDVNKMIKTKSLQSKGLDLISETASNFIPGISAIIKLLKSGNKIFKNKSSKYNELSELIEYKILHNNRDKNKEYISLLSQINRVARLKQDCN